MILRAICLALVALTAAGVVSGPPGPSALRRLAFVTLSSATQSPQPGLSKNDRDIVLTILRQVQDDVKKHYYDPAFHGIDLKARFAEAESRLQTVASFNEAMAILTASLTQLDDSHTALYPPNRATHADYGWRMAIVGNQVLVVDVTDGSDAAAQGVAPGDQVLSLNRFVPTRDNLWQIAHLYRFVRPQAQQHLVIRKPDGTERALDIRSKVTTRRLTELADLIAEIEETERQRRDRSATVGDNILVWKMNGFGSLDAVQEATKRARKHKAFVIDLRGNGGGAVDALAELVSRTFDHDLEIFTLRQRARDRVERARPKDAFEGKLIVLVDSQTASAAEMFARVVQLDKRGAVIGDRTAGMVMVSEFFPHTVGIGAVAFYATSITVGDVRMSDGASLEKIGVTPDEIALPAPADLAARRDPVLARAIALAGGSMTPEAASKVFGDRK